MFVIKELFVEDRNLAKLLTNVAGLVLQMSPPQPVVNATAKAGKVVAKSPAGSKTDLFLEKVKAIAGNTTLTKVKLIDLMVASGGQASSSTGAIKRAVDDGLLLRRSRGTYVRSNK